jgi:hypothetical protein
VNGGADMPGRKKSLTVIKRLANVRIIFNVPGLKPPPLGGQL